MAAIHEERPAPVLTPWGYGARIGLALLLLTAGVAIALQWWPCHLARIAACGQ
jgi:hypothetical protein